MKHFIDILDHTTDELLEILERAAVLKKRKRLGIPDRTMVGKTLGMYFDKPSLRTHVSLEVAMATMGGTAIYLSTFGQPLGKRECIADQARVMSRFVDIISIRTFGHAIVREFAAYATVPVINALSDESHPTQAMADIMTFREYRGSFEGQMWVFVGDGNNVARSLAALCAKVGLGFRLACPRDYAFSEGFLESVRTACPGCRLEVTHDPVEAVRDAAVVYTDVWTSMGQEEESEVRKRVFRPYQVNAQLMAHAPKDALVMHCLPAHRGEEITDEVIDSPASVVFDEAENRMHINRGLFSYLLSDR